MRTDAIRAGGSARRVALVASTGAGGLVTLVVGTFLPWLTSGSTDRNIYRAGGALRRLLGVHGIEAIGLDVLPFVGLWCAAVAIAYAYGYRRTACVGGLLVAAAGLSAAIGALVSGADGLVKGAAAGPVVTILGAVCVAAAASVLLLPGRAGLSQQEHP